MLEYGKCTLVYEAVNYLASISVLPTALKARGKTLVSSKEYDYALVSVLLLPQRALNASYIDTDSVSHLLSHFSQILLFVAGQRRMNPRKIFSSQKLHPALPHSCQQLFILSGTMTRLKVIRFSSNLLVENHPSFKVPEKRKGSYQQALMLKREKERDSFNFTVQQNWLRNIKLSDISHYCIQPGNLWFTSRSKPQANPNQPIVQASFHFHQYEAVMTVEKTMNPHKLTKHARRELKPQ